MVQKLAAASAGGLIRSGAISEGDREVYEYGFAALYSRLASLSLAVAIAIAARMAPQAAAFHIAFIALRSSAGGWHAPTRLACFFLSAALFAFSLWGSAHIAPQAASIGLAAFSAALVWASAPIGHENSPMGEAKRARMKKKARALSIGLLAAVALANIAPPLRWAAMPLALGMASQGLLAIMALASKKAAGKGP